nr:HNH endonuclease signature motif containing protein [Amycolatopsis sp. CA-230715]
MVSEVALVCKLSEVAAEKRTALAVALTSYLPRTLEALESGLIDEYAASRVFDATACLPEELARQVDSLLVGRFDVRNASALRRIVNSIIMRIDPDGYEERRQRRIEARRLELRHGDHGSSSLFADLPAEQAQAIYAACDRDAMALKLKGDPRTMDQLRVDCFVARCLGGSGDGKARAEIFVYVDINTLLGLRDGPAELGGYGDISAAMAREIAFKVDSTWRRIVTDPITGLPCDEGRRTYRAPRAVRRHAHLRHRTCCMPGCNRPAQFTDLDHATPWREGGGTDKVNLRPLCRVHHLLRNEPGWTFTTDDNGRLVVTTPSGRTYTEEAPMDIALPGWHSAIRCGEPPAAARPADSDAA